MSDVPSRPKFTLYAWFVLGLNMAVILWGAVVRATGSGAGCGEHWPLCNGQVVPPAPQLKTLIEYGHRLTSGVALICVVGLVIWAFRAYPRKHPVRKGAVLSLVFELTEALIGAGLVLLGHVAANASVQRGYSLGLHLSNTLLLLAALALTAWLSRPGRVAFQRAVTGQLGNFRPVLAVAAAGIVLIGITGAIAALGDTLFGASSLAAGMRQDFSPSSHIFLRLRILHPIVAAALGFYLLGLASYVLAKIDVAAVTKRLGVALIGLIMLQLCLGLANLVLMAPVPIQLMHLLLADLLWITFVLFSTELLSPSM